MCPPSRATHATPRHPTDRRAPSHAFVRVHGDLPTFQDDDDLTVTACSHFDIDGSRVTEALVSGPGAEERVAAVCQDAAALVALVAPIKHHEWMRATIMAAAGRLDEREDPPGMIAMHALRADEDELYMVSHPDALCATNILAQISRGLSRWVEL